MNKMSGNPRKRPRNVSDDVDVTRCIICQNETKYPTTGTERGRIAIQEAAEIRKDIVHDRLLRLDNNNFVYHVTYYCYLSYTHTKSLLNLSNDSTSTKTDDNNNDTSTRIHRSDVKPRSKSLMKESHYKTVCIVCCQIRYKGKHDKSRISDSSMARNFLKATVSMQDDVFLRTYDLQDEHSVFGANLYYHKLCMLNYFRRYDDTRTTLELGDNRNSLRQRLFSTCVSVLEEKIQSKSTVSLRGLRDHLNKSLPANQIKFSNRQLRMMIYDHFGEDIYITRGSRIYESAKVISARNATATTDVDPNNILKQCAQVLRGEVWKTDFDLCDRFCDSNELKDSWENTKIPTAWHIFFGTLFKIDKQTKRRQGLKYNTISTDAVNDNCGNNIDNDTSNDSDIGDENETLDSAKGNHDDDDDYDDEEEEDDNVDAYVDENDETIHDHVVVFTASVKVGNQMAAARTHMYFFQYQWYCKLNSIQQ